SVGLLSGKSFFICSIIFLMISVFLCCTSLLGFWSHRELRLFPLPRRSDRRMRRVGSVATLESVREHHEGLHSFRSMRRMEARRRKASALRLRHSQSLASLRQRPSQARVRSTIQRLGRVTKPLAGSDRLTISTLTRARMPFIALWNYGP